MPLPPKLIMPGTLLYLLFPVDLVPDFFPGLGQLDDLTVLALSVMLFLRLCPKALVREHLEALAGRPRKVETKPSGRVIDGRYEILE